MSFSLSFDKCVCSSFISTSLYQTIGLCITRGVKLGAFLHQSWRLHSNICKRSSANVATHLEGMRGDSCLFMPVFNIFWRTVQYTQNDKFLFAVSHAMPRMAWVKILQSNHLWRKHDLIVLALVQIQLCLTLSFLSNNHCDKSSTGYSDLTYLFIYRLTQRRQPQSPWCSRGFWGRSRGGGQSPWRWSWCTSPPWRCPWRQAPAPPAIGEVEVWFGWGYKV